MCYQWQGSNLILQCVVQPKASNDGFMGLVGNRLKIRITAPPTDGKANKHLIKFLAKQFKVPQGSVTLLGGEHSRMKKILITSPVKIPHEMGIDLKTPENSKSHEQPHE